MDLRLLVLQGKPHGIELPVRFSPFLIGRGPECHLRPNSDMVSRRHCALMVHGEEVLIRDLGSTNGTIVDGERLMGDLVLTEGDLFQVGPLVFQIVIRPAKTPSPQPTAGPGSQSGTAQAPSIQGDEIVQWLVSDSKNEVPATGSGVYSGKTVFVADDQNKQPETGSEPKDPVRDSATDAAKGDSGGAHPPTKGHATPHTVVEYGAAAHAAEDMLRHFLHRRPHR